MARPTAFDSPPTLLIVDDAPENLAMLVELLKGSYKTRVATSGERALALAAAAPPDLILLDVVMPGLDGHEVCRRLKANPATEAIPVIFLTSRGEPDDEQRGLEVGAVDYVSKPVNPPVLLARIGTHVSLKRATDTLRESSHELARQVAARTRELVLIQDATILAMASLAETRDNETGNHIRRTQNYVRELAIALRDHPRFRDFLTDETIELLYKSAPLHDIGKVGVPDHILLKPGKLTPEEFEQMKLHTVLGREAIARAEQGLGDGNSFLRFAREIAGSHQEKWDGSGYPEGLRGEHIPISARLMAVADVYDALISRRVYKPAFSHERAVAILREGRGSHFDPDIVDAFLAHAERFEAIARQFSDQ